MHFLVLVATSFPQTHMFSLFVFLVSEWVPDEAQHGHYP